MSNQTYDPSNMRTDLDDSHRRELVEGSSIDLAVVVERGYRTIGRPSNTDDRPRRELESLRIPSWATAEDRYFPGLAIPWYRATGERMQVQWKPRVEVVNRDGKKMKYANAKGVGCLIDVHPRWSRDRGQEDAALLPAIRDIRRPLWITEGIKKADALTSRDQVTVAVNGVFNWRAAHGSLGDWEDIPLRGRDVRICFDSDARTKRQVLAAMKRLGRWLKSKGVKEVTYLIPPARFDGVEIKGVDDLFAAGGDVSDLVGGKVPPDPIVAVDGRFTDAALAEEVAAEVLEGCYAFTTGLGWLAWTGNRWATADDGEIEEQVRRWVRAKFGEALDRQKESFAKDDEQARGQAEIDAAGFKSYSSAAKISALVKLAKNIDGVKRDAADFDRDPDVLNTPSGLLHLDSMHLERHHPDMLVTKITAVDYRPGSTDPSFKQVLESVPQDAESWLQAALGEAVTGHQSKQLVMMTGGGSNGKTALFNTVYRALGGGQLGGFGYAALVPNTLLLSGKQKGAATPEKMTLRGLRLAYMEETPEERFLDVNALKEVVDTESITGRDLYKSLVEFAASHSIFLNTNHPPQVVETEHGTWRRLLSINFPYRYRLPNDAHGRWEANDRAGDPTLKAKLMGREALEAALAWVVEGSRRWYEAGRTLSAFELPSAIAEATHEWRASSDSILRFLDETVDFDPESWVIGQQLYDRYKSWMTNHGLSSPGDPLFKKRLLSHGGLPGAVEAVRRRPNSPGLSTSFGHGVVTGGDNPVHGFAGIKFKPRGSYQAF